MRSLTALLIGYWLAGCLPNDPTTIKGAGQDTDCAQRGGEVVIGLAGPTCAMPEPDAGKACLSSEQCSGFCLAKTRSCSPVRPYFGCHSLYENGEVVEICVD